MYRIKRTKLGPKPRVGEPTTAVHYATVVTPRGAIEGWSLDPAKAVPVDMDMLDRVSAFYHDRKNVGLLDAEEINPSAVETPQEPQEPQAAAIPEPVKIPARRGRPRKSEQGDSDGR